MEAEESKPLLQEVAYNPLVYKIYSMIMSYGILGVFCYLFWRGDSEDWMSKQRFWACLAICSGLVPFVVYFWRESMSRIPLFPLFCFYQTLGFGVGGLYRVINSTTDAMPQVLLPALKASVLGLWCLIIGYYWAGPFFFPRTPRFRLSFQPSIEELLPYAWLFVIADNVLEPIPRPWPLLYFLQQEVPVLGGLGIAILLVNFLRDGDLKKKSNFCLIFLVFPWEFLWRFATGFLGPVLGFFSAVGIIVLNYRKAIPFKLLIAAGLIYYLMSPVKAAFRSEVWYSGTDYSVLEKAQIWYDLAVKTYNHTDPFKTKDAPESLGRMNQLDILAIVINKSPAIVSFKNGITYVSLLTKFIPRIFWPGKPLENLGQAFGHWYGLLDPWDTSTSIDLPWLVEFYVNFGWAGIVGGMFLVGILLYLMAQILCDENLGTLEYCVSVSLVSTFWLTESNLSLIVGNLSENAIQYWLMFWFAKKLGFKITRSSG